MRLAIAWREHLHRCLVGVQHALGQYLLLQRVHQRLQVHTADADPGAQRRLRDRQASARVDTFLPIERKMVTELGHQRMRQQAGGGDALVDDVRRNRCLREGLALPACPLTPDMAFDREHAGGVVQLLADVFANALERAAARASLGLWLVTDLSARQLGRQRLAFRLVLGLRLGRRDQSFQLGLDRLKVCIKSLFQQAESRACSRADLAVR
ncbi:hypothetical protein LMG23992_05116 [Cupriavidus laharis]|uniref:Uncharacterized protein n=1 Tax=Cupriavidus laharis TaxID=151654 RepID=A0ABN7ZI61_9BURK|nr:hypothetical protein LMG23992_05116 [Cupriavidus laharis]